MGLKPITEEERASFEAFSRANPRVCDDLPITLPSGFLVEDFNPECASCGQDIPSSSAWLKRDRMVFAHKTVETWEVRGVCRTCATMTPCYMRFHSDGHFDTIIGRNWRRGDLDESTSPVARIAAAIRKLFC